MFLSQLLYSVHTVSTSGFFHDVSFHVRFFLAVQLFHNWFYLCQTLQCDSKRKVCLYFANIAVKTKLFAHTKKKHFSLLFRGLDAFVSWHLFQELYYEEMFAEKMFLLPFFALYGFHSFALSEKHKIFFRFYSETFLSRNK